MVTFKEKCRVFYIIKGHLTTSKQTIEESYNSYFKRIWYNEESYLAETNFEEAYRVFMRGAKQDRLADNRKAERQVRKRP